MIKITCPRSRSHLIPFVRQTKRKGEEFPGPGFPFPAGLPALLVTMFPGLHGVSTQAGIQVPAHQVAGSPSWDLKGLPSLPTSGQSGVAGSCLQVPLLALSSELLLPQVSLPSPRRLASSRGLAVGLDQPLVCPFQYTLLLPCKGLSLAPPHPFLGTSHFLLLR